MRLFSVSQSDKCVKAFSENYALASVEIQSVVVQSFEFPDSHSGVGEQVNEDKVADLCAVVA